MAVVPLLTLLGTVVALVVVILAWKSPFRSPASLVSCFTTMLVISQYYQVYREAVLGLVILAMLVLFHNLFVQRRVAEAMVSEQLEMDLDIDDDINEDPDMGQPAPENL